MPHKSIRKSNMVIFPERSDPLSSLAGGPSGDSDSDCSSTRSTSFWRFSGFGRVDDASARLSRLAEAAALLVCGAGLFVLFWFDPAAKDSPYPPCLFRLCTGWLCPGCGSARALHALLHGHVLQALRFNAVAVVVAPLTGALFLRSIRTGKPMMPVTLSPGFVYLIGLALVMFGVVRNVAAQHG